MENVKSSSSTKSSRDNAESNDEKFSKENLNELDCSESKKSIESNPNLSFKLEDQKEQVDIKHNKTKPDINIPVHSNEFHPSNNDIKKYSDELGDKINLGNYSQSSSQFVLKEENKSIEKYKVRKDEKINIKTTINKISEKGKFSSLGIEVEENEKTDRIFKSYDVMGEINKMKGLKNTLSGITKLLSKHSLNKNELLQTIQTKRNEINEIIKMIIENINLQFFKSISKSKNTNIQKYFCLISLNDLIDIKLSIIFKNEKNQLLILQNPTPDHLSIEPRKDSLNSSLDSGQNLKFSSDNVNKDSYNHSNNVNLSSNNQLSEVNISFND